MQKPWLRLLMEEILHHLRCWSWDLNYQPQLVIAGFLNHPHFFSVSKTHPMVTFLSREVFLPLKGALEKMAVAVAFGNHDELQSLVHAAPATAPWVSNRRGFGVSLPDETWVVATHRFFGCFTPKIGEDFHFWLIFFQMGWNHQLVFDRQQQATGTSKYWTHWCGTIFFVFCVWTHWFFNGINAYYTYSCAFLKRFFLNMTVPRFMN